MRHIVFRKILYIISWLSVIVTAAAGIALPWLVHWYSGYVNKSIDFSVTVFIWLTLIPFLTILLAVTKLSGNLLKNQTFRQNSIEHLFSISIYAGIDFVLYCIGLTIFKNLVCMVVMCGTVMVFLISAVAQEVIYNGIKLQDDNDLTI